MKQLFDKPLIWAGVSLINKTNKVKAFKFYDDDKLILKWVLKPKESIISHDQAFGVMRFDYPTNLKSLKVDAGRKWEIVTRNIIENDEYQHFKYY